MSGFGRRRGGLRKFRSAGRTWGLRPDGRWLVWDERAQDWAPASPPDDLVAPRSVDASPQGGPGLRLPPVLAGGDPSGERGHAWRRRALIFLLFFTVFAAWTLWVEPSAQVVLIDLGAAAVFTAMWELRGTTAGVALIAVVLGGVAALALNVLWFVVSLMTWSWDESGPDFLLTWTLCSLAVFVVAMPFRDQWRPRRDRRHPWRQF